MEDSFLSQRIYSLLHENAYLPPSDSESLDDGWVFFDSIQKRLDLDVYDDTYEYYSRMVTTIRPHVFKCHALLQRLSTEAVITACFPYMEWSPYSNLVLSNLKRWKSEAPQSKDSCFRTLLQLGYLIERSLGCIYIYMSKKGKDICPNMLKDILNSVEIRSALGDALVAFIKVFLGPVTSLNLRNLAWHGFLRPCDIEPAYISILFFVFVDIGRALEQNGHLAKHLKPVDTKFNSAALARFPSFFEPTPSSMIAFSYLIASSSDSVPPSLVPFFTSALAGIQQGSSIALLDILSILLPLLEHVTRRIFVRTNKLPSSLLRASDGAFFCTFDEILSPLCASGAPNRLPDVVGPGAMSFLCDLLAYPAGPRLRDRMSHGDILPEECSLGAVCAVLSAFESFLAPRQPPWSVTYQSRFHPIELCRNELMSNFPPEPSLLFTASRVALDIVARSLFRPTEVEPLLSLLRQISAVAAGLSQCTDEFRDHRKAQLMLHQLRSRQRQNFARFEMCDTHIRRFVHLCHTVVVVVFVQVACEERSVETVPMTDLRRLVVVCEKARASADRAKWVEVHDLLRARTSISEWWFDRPIPPNDAAS